MIVLKPERKDIEHPNKTKQYSASLRLWHWLNAIVITGSLLTVLLNSTLLKTRNNAIFIKDQLHEAGGTVTTDQARSVAHELSDKVWALHYLFRVHLSRAGLIQDTVRIFSDRRSKANPKNKNCLQEVLYY